MNITPVSSQTPNEITHLLMAQARPDLFNNYRALICWMQGTPQIVRDDNLTMLFAVGEDIEVMRPLGEYDKEQMQRVLAALHELAPEKELWVYGVDDDNIEYFDKSRIGSLQLSYVLLAQRLKDLGSKKLRNAVVAFEKQKPVLQTLGPEHKEQARELAKAWAATVKESSTNFHDKLIDNFLDVSDPNYHGFILSINNQVVGMAYMARDVAFSEYANCLVNCTRKTPGASEYLLWKVGCYAKDEWNCTYVNYGGADPKDTPGLHSYKKKFGWNHILVEYAMKYLPEKKTE